MFLVQVFIARFIFVTLLLNFLTITSGVSSTSTLSLGSSSEKNCSKISSSSPSMLSLSIVYLRIVSSGLVRFESSSGFYLILFFNNLCKAFIGLDISYNSIALMKWNLRFNDKILKFSAVVGNSSHKFKNTFLLMHINLTS